MEMPESPLYGAGDSKKKNSYSGMMRIFEKGNRFTVSPSKRAYHWKRGPNGEKIKLSFLFTIHEYGCLIENGFGKGILIRIPARPALRLSYEALVAEKIGRMRPKEIRSAIYAYVVGGDAGPLLKLMKVDDKTEGHNDSDS
jgi:hypothetical protein